MPTSRFGQPRPRRDDAEARALAQPLVHRLRFELVPMKSAHRALTELPPGAHVSVTCSPAKGIAATLALTEQLLEHGHHVVPHLSARLVENPAQVAQLARWIDRLGVEEIFVVAGDSPTAAGPYEDALSFLRDLVEHPSGLARIGITAYPDGHAFIDADALHAALLDKQALLADAGVDGWATTQMCFDGPRIRGWLAARRGEGFALPIHLGVPGVVDRAALLKMGLRLGVGPSLRYLRKNRAMMSRLLSNGRYDASELVLDLAGSAAELGITGLHSFTFNQVAATRSWQEGFAI